ncbi:MAG: hypothetical protein IJ389_00700 [Clostridia bacterium]|nr:hypothetical protein [Clostridia bacterium]
MKRRIVSLLLCASMLLTGILATGCAGDGDDSLTTETGDESSALVRTSMTLTLWVPTECEVDEETGELPEETQDALEEVEAAINKITVSKYDTAIKLYAIPTDDYEEAVKKQMQDIKDRKEKAKKEAEERRKAEREAAKRGETLPPTEKADKEEGENPYDLIVNSSPTHPHVENNQMDIFLVRGYDDYKFYVDNMFVEALDEEINGTSKVLKQYIYPDFLEAAKVDGITYAVPNNHMVGEYTYLLANKELATKYGKTETDLMNIFNNYEFVKSVAENEEGVTPVWGEISPDYIQYWSGQGSGQFSVLATNSKAYDPTKKIEALEGVVFKNVMDVQAFYDSTYYQKLYTENGWISNAESVDNFAYGFVTTTPDVVEEMYGDTHYIYAYRVPQGTLDDYCASMFAVSSHTKDKARAMEIITHLNTQTDLRTILQYGVEGTHWKYDEIDDSVIVKTSDVYKMNINDTGNVYMTYPDYNTPMIWDASKKQNLDSFYPVTYYMTDYVHDGNKEIIAEFDKFCAEIKKEIDGMTAAEFKDQKTRLKDTIDRNPYYQMLTYTNGKYGKTEEDGYFEDNSIVYMWSEKVKLIKEG